jgi:hypothetical protein
MLDATGPPVDSAEADQSGTPAEHLDKLFKDCGISPEKVNPPISLLY